MAEDFLIDAYLEELRRTLRRHRDVDDLIDEVADHLQSRAQELGEHGVEPATAQRRALAAFGDPLVVARTYAVQRRAGLAIPTRFTRAAGALLLAGGAAWIWGLPLLVLSTVADRTRPWEGLPRSLYLLGAWPLILGAVALWVGLIGVYRRHGGGRGLPVAGLAALGLAALGVWAPWFIFLWIPLLAVGGSLFATWLRQRDLAPRTSALALAIGPLVACVVVLTVATLGAGNLESFSYAQQQALESVLSGSLAVFAGGIVGLGRWLRAERAVEDAEQALMA